MADKYYVFIDIETTGLSPVEDEILELAWIIMRDDNHIIQGDSNIIEQEFTWSTTKIKNEFIKNMHTKSGLLKEYDLGDHKEFDFVLDDLFDALCYIDAQYDSEEDRTFHWAGFSVHFDIDFLRTYALRRGEDSRESLASIEAWMHHRRLDMSGFKQILQDVGLEFNIPNDRPHRAMNDVEETIAAYKMAKYILNAFDHRELSYVRPIAHS